LLLKHPRFHWTAIEQEKLKLAGKTQTTIKMGLVCRIVQQCENEVLSLIHRSFIDCGWIVRAKIFDGLIVEKGTTCIYDNNKMINGTLGECLREAEKLCCSFGWNIKIAEKSMHGLQHSPIRPIEDARRVMNTFRPFHLTPKLHHRKGRTTSKLQRYKRPMWIRRL
jgi:hypothetical protein